MYGEVGISGGRVPTMFGDTSCAHAEPVGLRKLSRQSPTRMGRMQVWRDAVFDETRHGERLPTRSFKELPFWCNERGKGLQWADCGQSHSPTWRVQTKKTP